ncbi:uncharacterized protein DUF2521 [Salsuginibacillus halophilus]|uniref:Uncharacterized protein DUF2521 n=1 Tax=Salsuginibacillus halophilus TaxID=517424 RepID=A0A2P8H8P7_9BACI|nr:DUF2521 family protein [Salsuginibacillus halophilus]PSL42598.1 uncharacterized protein DUF2521 [Salsuginibacillus halophilus]
MAVVSLAAHKQEKIEKQDERLIRAVSREEVENSAARHIAPVCASFHFRGSFLEEACLDLGVEAYLQGGRTGYRTGKRGKTGGVANQFQLTQEALQAELTVLLLSWVHRGTLSAEELRRASRAYTREWWERGFETGRRHRCLKY